MSKDHGHTRSKTNTTTPSKPHIFLLIWTYRDHTKARLSYCTKVSPTAYIRSTDNAQSPTPSQNNTEMRLNKLGGQTTAHGENPACVHRPLLAWVATKAPTRRATAICSRSHVGSLDDLRRMGQLRQRRRRVSPARLATRL
jgi:hypothetical protein